MKAALDVWYDKDTFCACCVVFEHWEDARASEVVTLSGTGVGPYRPGRFFERELPCLLAVLERASIPFDAVVIDGYVDLDGSRGKGLGRHLYEALGGRSIVVGVAKSPLSFACRFVPIFRGSSTRPVYVSGAGCPEDLAAAWVSRMHGPYRIPTLLALAHRSAVSCGRRRP